MDRNTMIHTLQHEGNLKHSFSADEIQQLAEHITLTQRVQLTMNGLTGKTIADKTVSSAAIYKNSFGMPSNGKDSVSPSAFAMYD